MRDVVKQKKREENKIKTSHLRTFKNFNINISLASFFLHWDSSGKKYSSGTKYSS